VPLNPTSSHLALAAGCKGISSSHECYGKTYNVYLKPNHSSGALYSF